MIRTVAYIRVIKGPATLGRINQTDKERTASIAVRFLFCCCPSSSVMLPSKHKTFVQRRPNVRWSNIVQMSYKCFVFAGSLGPPEIRFVLYIHISWICSLFLRIRSCRSPVKLSGNVHFSVWPSVIGSLYPWLLNKHRPFRWKLR